MSLDQRIANLMGAKPSRFRAAQGGYMTTHRGVFTFDSGQSTFVKMSTNTNILRFAANILRFTAASVALAVPALASPPEKLLLPQATRAATRTRGEMIPIPTRADGLGIVVDASWLSDHEILHVVHGVLCRYDIISHVNTALPALQHQLAASAPFSVTFAASPDSQWVRWDQANVNPTFCAASVDGSKCVHWPADGEVGQSFWCADSRHWLRFRFGELTPRTPFHLPLVYARLEDINHPQSAATFAVPPGLRDLEVLAAVSEHEVVARTPDPVLPYQAPKHPRLPRKARNKAPFEDSNVLTVTNSITQKLRTTQEISVWDLAASTSLRRYTVTLPSTVLAVAVSQQGDRAAWLLSAWKNNRLTTSLWVSGLDGSSLHEVGAIPADTVGATSQTPTDVCWLPGDKSVGFVYKDAFWAVVAD